MGIKENQAAKRQRFHFFVLRPGRSGEPARGHQLPGSGAPHIREKFSKNGRDGHGTGRERRRPAERFL